MHDATFFLVSGLEKRTPHVLFSANKLKHYADTIIVSVKYNPVLVRQVDFNIITPPVSQFNLSTVYNYALSVCRTDFAIFVSDDEMPSDLFLQNMDNIFYAMHETSSQVGKVRYVQVVDSFIYGYNEKFYAEKIIYKKMNPKLCYSGDLHLLFDLNANRYYIDCPYIHYKSPNQILFSCYWPCYKLFFSSPEELLEKKEFDFNIYNMLKDLCNNNYAYEYAYLYYVCVLFPNMATSDDIDCYLDFVKSVYSEAMEERRNGRNDVL